jgi:hypothetical protein
MRSGPIGCRHPLRHDAFQAHLTGVPEYGGAVRVGVLVKLDPWRRAGEQPSQPGVCASRAAAAGNPPPSSSIRSKANRMAPALSRATRRRVIAALAAREPGGLRPPRFERRPFGIAKLKDAPAGKRRAPALGVFREWPSWRRLLTPECE